MFHQHNTVHHSNSHTNCELEEGDTLSPKLLTDPLELVSRKNWGCGVCANDKWPYNSHLCFADDIILIANSARK